jgi:hypothetical protein
VKEQSSCRTDFGRISTAVAKIAEISMKRAWQDWRIFDDLASSQLAREDLGFLFAEERIKKETRGSNIAASLVWRPIHRTPLCRRRIPTTGKRAMSRSVEAD